ncbi:DUF4157 domain-containing protein [Streptomyces sp. SHP 1-2]|nr:DUF4157 domain-containing protein [Streptomyces sp. SHP 1-2]
MGAHARQKDNDAASYGSATRRAPKVGVRPGERSSVENIPVAQPILAAPERMAALQRTVGNSVVVEMLRRLRSRDTPGSTPPVQRSTVHEVLRAPGQPLDAGTRAEMEGRFGVDFSDVRLHTGAAAQRSAAEIGARAYTSENHVVIGAGGGDKKSLAHELTHVIQQRQGPVAATDNGDGLSVSDPRDRFEREAEATAARALAGSLPSRPGTTADGNTGADAADTAADTIQRTILDSQKHKLSPEEISRNGMMSELLAQYPAEIHERVEVTVDILLESDPPPIAWENLVAVLRDEYGLHPGPTHQAPRQSQPVPQAAPQYTQIDITDAASFLHSIASLWHASQGNTGCGLLGNTLYLSTSSSNRPAFFDTIWGEVQNIRATVSSLPSWFPTDWEACPGYKDTSSNHAECRIMHAWGDGGGNGGIIRTNQPACRECAHLMNQQGIAHDNASTRKYGLTGWIHPFTLEFYGPQTTDSRRYDLE